MMASKRKLLLLCAFVVGAVAVPVAKREQCARYCTEEGDFKLRPGSTYTYDYETTTATTVQGSSQDKTQIQLTAQVDIEVLSKCDLSLRLRGVTLKLSDPESPDYLNAIRGARDFAHSIERQILRFSFQNGKVEHVCPSENVPAWVTNIQKGVLSAFQTYILQPDWSTTAVETDVLGKCTAEYQSLGTSWQGTHTIRKLKDLTSCTERENVDTYLQGTPYSQDFQKKSLPLVKGSQECEQVLGQGYLHSSTCREKLVFRPFSNGGSSVITSVTQKLSYSTVSQRTFTGNDYRPTMEPLLYRHADMEENPSRREADAETVLKDLCDVSAQDISITVPRKFSAFVYKLKKLQLASLKAFHQKIDRICPGNSKARKFFMDAIPLVATTDSAKFMFELISRNEISKAESNIWLTSLSFISEPTAEIIGVFTPLLEGQHEQGILGASAMIHTFCQTNDCSQVLEVQRAVHKLFRNLGENCFSGTEKKVLLTLKAIANIGHFHGKEQVLEFCYKNPQLRLETRLAAIQAYRRSSCDTSRDELMRLFSNYNEDPEIRIASYLAVMTCPSTTVVDAVKEVLMGERINHVGSFIWTHLNALARTKHPQRQDIRNIVSNLYLLNKYNPDAGKFSTAREATFFLQALDSGFHVDNHLIFSTDSYLPRTAMFNLTLDVFGKTCNLFQIDGRMEGLEHFAESFFGPSGYFPQKKVAKMLREKRSISSNKIQDMDEKFQAKSRFQQSPYGSLDVKIFGTTLWYNQFKENDDGTPEINLLDVVAKLAEDHDAEYSKSFMFLDTTFTVPMTSGLPLRIAVNGTASVALKYGGKFDVKSFDHVDIQGNIEPSGAIEIASLLSVDAGNVARSGLRVVGTMHSSTVLDGKIEIKNGEVVKAQLNMPRDRIDVFNFQSKVFLVHGPEEREQKVDKKGETNMKSCTGATTSKLFGVELCSELRLPPYKPNAALHPVNGPANFNIYIQKTDPTLKSYTFDAEWKLDLKNGAIVRHGIISLNTPDSKVDRDVRAELYVNHADHTASLKIKTPVKRLGANAKLVNDKALSKLAMELTVDDKEYFSLQTELRTILDKNAVTYIPSLEVRIPNRKLTSITGSVYSKPGQRYTAQLQIEELTEKPILAKGNIEIGKKDRYDGELSINSFALDGTLKGYAQLGNNMASRITAEYKFLEGKTNKINIMGKMRNLSANSLSKYDGLLNIQASLLPEWNTELSFETMKTAGHVENTVSISLGDGVRSRVHNIRLQEILRYEGDLRNNKVDGSFSILYPEKNIDYALKINHENTESSLKNTLDVQYNRNKHVVSEAKFNMNKDSFTVSGDVKLKYPGREMALGASVSETSPKEYTTTLSCQWKEGRQSSIVVNYKDKTDASRLKYEIEGEMNMPLRSPVTFSSVIGGQRGQFAGFAEVNVGVDKYRIKADYGKGNGYLNHRATGQLILNNKVYGLEAALQNAGKKLNGNLEVKLPNRHRITAVFEGRTGDFLRSGSFETLWDADRDSSKRFGVTGELRNHADGYEGKLIMQILRRTVTGTVSTSSKGHILSSQWNTNNRIEIEWSPSEKATAAFSSNFLLDRSRQEANGQLEITTPYFNYENLSLSLSHFYANQQWESELSTILPKKNQIQLSTSGKYSFVRGGATIETKTRLQSTFSYLRDTYFELAHDHSTKELTSKAQLRWAPGKRITLDASGVAQSSVYKASLKFTSPFRNFEDLSTELIHNNTPDNYRTRAEFQWAARRKVSLNFEGKHVLNGRRRICTATLSGSSPFQDFENTAAKVTYSNDGSALSTDVELTWSERKKITSSFTGSTRSSPYSRNVESKFIITTPFRDYENYQVSTSLETNRNSYKVNVDAQLPQRSTASFNSQGKLLNFDDIELSAVLIAHFPRYMQPQRASVDFVHKLQNSKLRSTLDAAINKHRLTVLLNGLSESGYDNRNVEFSATVNTPFNGFEEIKCNFNHNQRRYEYITKLEGSKNALRGSLTHKLSVRDSLNFETTLEAASSEFADAKLSVIQVYSAGQFEHNSYATWARNRRINFNTQYLDKAVIKEFTLKLTTPFSKLREFEVKSNYESQNWDQKATLFVAVDRRHKMTLSGSARNFRWKNVVTQLEFTSTFRGHEFYSTSFKYDLTAPQKTVEASYLWDASNRKAVTIKGNFLHSYNLCNVDFEVTTPFEGFSQITFATKLENNSPEYNFYAMYNRESRKVEFTGKALLQKRKSEIYASFVSPFRNAKNVKCLAKYEISNEGFSALISTDHEGYGDSNKYLASLEYKRGNGAAEGKISLITPFSGYRTVDAEANVNYGGSRKVADASIKWDDDNSVLWNSEYATRRDGRSLRIGVQTSFENYEQLNFDSWYKSVSGKYEGEIKASRNRNEVYEGNVAVKYGGDHFVDIKLNIASPDFRLRNMRLATVVDSETGLQRVSSSLTLNDRESTLVALYRRERDTLYEVNVEIKTPYNNFRLFNLQSSLMKNSYDFVSTRLKLETPFQALRELDVQSEIKLDDSGCVLSFSFRTPEKTFNLDGKVSNRQFRPFTAVFDIDAPFLSFKKLSANADINIVRWDNSKISLSVSTPRSRHELGVVLLREDGSLDFQIKLQSPEIPSRTAIFTAKAIYGNEMESELSLQLFGKVHYLNGQLGRSDRNTEVQIRMESPLLPEKKADIIASFSRKRSNKILEAKLIVTVPSSAHEVSARYENKNSQIITNFKIDSSILKSSPFEAQAKYTNSNDKDFEASITASTPRASHSVVASLKNYAGEKFVQLKIECPMVDFLNAFSITGTLKHDNYESLDGSLSFGADGKELRLAGNMKNDGWKNVEAFVTLNTPFEVLRMFRVDGRFRNDRFQNIDWNFQIETSNRNFPSLGVTSKISRTKGSEEVSLMLHLPLKNYRQIQLLANAHYEADFSSADSRITLTMAPKRYSVSGQYGINSPRISGTAELEYNGIKWVASGRLESTPENNDVSVSFITPDNDRYNFGGAYGRSGNKHFVAASYISPANAKYDVNTSLSFNDLRNFETTLQVQTPYSEYRNFEASVNQQYNPNYLSTNLEFLKNGRRGYFKVLHRNVRNSVTGSVQLSCPFHKIRDLKLSYNHLKKSRDQEFSLELDLNRVKQFKAELMQFGDKSSHVILDAPVLPLTMTADSKQLSYGKELNFKSEYGSRIVGFRTSFQLDSAQILHDASLTWDEKAEKRISYDFKLGETSTGRQLWSRLDTPLRAFMLEGNFTKANRASSGGINFYWDASRNLEKHAAVGVEFTDMSTGNDYSTRTKVSLEHPRLSRDIAFTNTLSINRNEMHMRNELVYSKQRHHHVLMEVKLNDLSRSKDSHFKGEFVFRHPAARFDIRTNGEIIHNKLETFVNMKLQSMDKRQVQHVHELKGAMSKIKQQIDLVVRSDNDVQTFVTSATSRNGRLEISAVVEKNEEKLMLAVFKVIRANNSVDFSVTGAGDRGFHVVASYPKESISARVWHDISGNAITDVNLFFGLEQSKILKTQLNWRPKMWKELRITTGENLRAFVRALKERYTAVTQEFLEDLSDRQSFLSLAVRDQFTPFVNEISSDVSEIGRDLKSARLSLQRMYRNNEFHMLDIVRGIENAKNTMKEVISGLSLGLDVLYNVIYGMAEDLYYDLVYGFEDFVANMQVKYALAVKRFSLYVSDVKERLRKVTHDSAESLERFCFYMKKKVQDLSEKAVVKVDKLVRSYAPFIIDGFYYVKNAADSARNYFNKLYNSASDYVESNKYFVAVRNYAANVAETFRYLVDFEYTETAQSVFNQIYDTQLIDSIINHPNIEYASELTNNALIKSVQIYHNLGMDIVVDSALQSAKNYAKEVFFNAVEELLSDMHELKGGAKYEFAPHRGYVAIEFNLPIPRYSLAEVFDFKSYPEYHKITNLKNNLSSEFYEDFCVWDYYYKFLKYFSPGYWLPTFTGHAMIAGNQHYITFDKFSYDFAGKCSYLLARDFVDGNFTVIVNYGNDHLRKSLTVFTEGRKVDIGNDYKITLDDTKAESPLQIGQTVVMREGANIRIENDKKGYLVLCNFIYNYCSVSVSGFYYAKTGGLFGTFNYEPKLDMLTPTRHMATDLDNFANSWEVGQTSCRSTENFATIPGNDLRVHEKCKNMFSKSSSEFRACFKQVDPEPFLRMCVSDLSIVHERNFDEAICESAAAYFVQCKLEGVQLRLPSKCVRCEKQDGTMMKEGDALKFTRGDTINAADVVLLVEEKECNRERVRYVGKLAQTIEDNYKQKGYNDVRFSVVAFGGNGIHSAPHVHTLDGQISGPLRSLESALESLQFGDGPVNILEAMRYAAALNFRAGATKSFILMKCSTCKSEEVKAEYSQMLRTLLDGDISLHLLAEDRYEIKGSKTSKSRKVFGVDKNLAYTLKDVKDTRLSGDGDLLAQLKIPKDVCIPLAFEVSGSSFDAQFLTDTKKSTSKKFMDVFARRVVRSSSRTSSEWGMCCECIATVDGAGKSTCQRCVSAEIADMISAETTAFNAIASGPVREKPKTRVRKHKERKSGQ